MNFTRWNQAGNPLACLLALALALGLSACSGGSDDSFATTTLASALTGEQEVPAVVTGAVGAGTVTLQPTLALSGSLTLDGMTASAAHIHTGEAGVNGPVIVPLVETSPGTWSVPAGTNLSAEQAITFLNGGLYFNAHNAANPNGEIRGQIGRDVFDVRLTPSQEVPPAASAASGTGRVILDPVTRRFSARITVSGMAATAAHIHDGAPGVNGPVLFPLTQTATGSGVWVAASDAMLTEAQVTQLRGGGLYFNAHSVAFPGGEIRGQIARHVGVARLVGAEEVPPTPSTATGTGTLVIDPATRATSGGITVSGLTPQAAHVHLAPAGVNGPVIVPLANSAANVWSVPAGTRLTADQFAAFKRGALYFNAHTPAFPGGEIRGQIR